MDEFFGVSMNLIMYVLLAILGVALASVALVAVRNRIMFKLGVRNIPRRRAQTVLIVVGLMLSTVIISAAFTTGDTVARSVTSEVYGLLGSMDEVIQPGRDEDQTFDDASQGIARSETFSADAVAPLIDQIAKQPHVDFVLPTYADIAVAVNLQGRLSSPLFSVRGLDPVRSRGLPDLETTGGQQVEVADLRPGEIFINESAADELDVSTGDSITLFSLGKQTPFTVKAVLKDSRLAGAGGISVRREGGVLPLATAQAMFDAPGQLTQIVVSNTGDSRGGLAYADEVKTSIEQQIQAGGSQLPALSVAPAKQDGVDIADESASFFTTFFLVLGLFSIGAGVLLIFMIFVMLAAERKPEMGMARAVGLKRGDLVQTFLAEGMAYNVLAALVGTGLGVGVAVIMAKIMAAIFSALDLTISPHVEVRSLVISYALGVVLTFLTVTFSSWRVSHINIVRAIRDIPEPPPDKPLWSAHGIFPTLRDLFFKPTDRTGWLRRAAIFVGLICLGISSGTGLLPLSLLGIALIGGAFFSYTWSQKTLSPLFRVGLFVLLVITSPVALAVSVFMVLQLGPLFMVTSIPLIIAGASGHTAFFLLFGLSLLPLGLALTARSFGAPERLTYTLTGVFLIYIWEIDFSVGLLDKIFGKTEGDIEMFFLSGLMVTLAATFVVVYNADIILGPLTKLGKHLGALLPSIKMAVAYPLANRTRTGMTMAMFCLVVFALTVMSSMNHNFNRLFLSDRALGGWDVVVDENPTNPIGDLRSALSTAQSPALSQIDSIGVSEIVTMFRGNVCQITAEQPCDPQSKVGGFADYSIWGDDPGFFATGNIALQLRAPGYASNEDAWRAVASNPSLAIVDAFALPGGGFGDTPILKEVDTKEQVIQPVDIVLRNDATGASQKVTIIGVIELGSSASFSGLHVSKPVLDNLYGDPDFRRFFVRTVDGANNLDVAREIESALLTTGAQADSLRHQVDEQNATFSGFFYLMQGFMGLGLFVGVAAVGVIAFRTVVERRQQIGMLRALGYTKRMVGMTFLIESAFIALMGVLSGVIFALILARQLIVDEFANQGVTTFAVPWLQIIIISGLAFGFALLMTLIPSRQAASIPIAEALRYE